ncbi:hypothetical protein GGQ20_001464 [Salinibacter ruber]|nr:hypothetical protein [Salinibacter ruber]
MDSAVGGFATDVIESCESKELGLPGLVAGMYEELAEDGPEDWGLDSTYGLKWPQRSVVIPDKTLPSTFRTP